MKYLIALGSIASALLALAFILTGLSIVALPALAVSILGACILINEGE
jgi:hypothetical protein